MREFCREIVHKVPRHVGFVEEYPMTASGKIQKYKFCEAAFERHGLVEMA